MAKQREDTVGGIINDNMTQEALARFEDNVWAWMQGCTQQEGAVTTKVAGYIIIARSYFAGDWCLERLPPHWQIPPCIIERAFKQTYTIQYMLAKHTASFRYNLKKSWGAGISSNATIMVIDGHGALHTM